MNQIIVAWLIMSIAAAGAGLGLIAKVNTVTAPLNHAQEGHLVLGILLLLMALGLLLDAARRLLPFWRQPGENRQVEI